MHGAASALVSARDACAQGAVFVHRAMSASTRAQRCARRGCEFTRVACISVCMKWVQWAWGQAVCMHAGPPHSFPSSAPLGVPACLRPPAHFWGPLILGGITHIGPSRAAAPEDWISLHGCNAGVGTRLTTPGGANLWLLFSNPDRLHCFVQSQISPSTLRVQGCPPWLHCCNWGRTQPEMEALWHLQGPCMSLQPSLCTHVIMQGC